MPSIAAGHRVNVDIHEGFPEVLGELATRAAGARSFLRAAWYAAGAPTNGKTILAAREDGSVLAAIPIAPAGPPIAGVRTVPGSYWPFRSILIDAAANEAELAAVFAEPKVRATLAPAWRMGPVYRDDLAVTCLKRAAAQAGWTVLIRSLGHTYMFELGALIAAEAWPRPSTRRRLSNYRKQLGREGEVHFRCVSGSERDEEVLDLLSTIEANSWVGKNTDGSGAKFLRPSQRDFWCRVTRDPFIADRLSATILMVGQTPAAFSFDLRVDDTQYSIASSFAEQFASARPGKIVTYYQLERAAAQGVQRVDLGAGDSGYKRELGAVAGSEIIDLLIVKSRSMAQILQLPWGGECELGRHIHHQAAAQDDRNLWRPILAAGTMAAAAVAMTE